MRKAFQNLVAANYPQVATELLEPLVRLLQLGRAHCGGDADRFLILAVITLRASQHHEFRASTTELLTSGEIAVLPSLGVNIRSIVVRVKKRRCVRSSSPSSA